MITQTYAIVENGFYKLDEDGVIPVTIWQDDNDANKKLMFVCPRASQFSMIERQVQMQVEQYAWNSLLGRWDLTDTGKFISQAMTVNDTTMVDAQGNIVTEGGVMTEFEAFALAIFKPSIAPLIYTGIERRINQLGL